MVPDEGQFLVWPLSNQGLFSRLLLGLNDAHFVVAAARLISQKRGGETRQKATLR